jgi:PKD repeat protein
MKLLFLIAFSCCYVPLFGHALRNLEEKSVWDTIISNPISVDSLYIFPSLPKEGDTVTLYAATTHSSSPCGLLDYKVVFSAANNIYIDPRYWEGMLTAICQSTDKMNIGSLKAGRYILSFMNMKKIEFTVYPKNNCQADFLFEYLRCTEPSRCANTIQFFDKSLGNITTWEWNFGDSTKSNEQNPVHTYKSTGIYNVCLKVAGGTSTECIDTKCKLVPLPQNSCKALFKYQAMNLPTDSSEDSSMIPFPAFLVKFNDLSAGNVVAWKWDFGDGSFSTLQNPMHRYGEGEYIVTLKIVTKEGCESNYTDTLTLFDPIPICKFTGTVRDYTGLDGCKYIIELDNGIKLEPVRVIPPFVFTDSQRVILAYRPLRVASICMVGITAEITCIRELPVPICKSYFYYNKDTTANCICYNFYDKSIGKVNTWHWDFGDGSTSSEQNPKHVFNLTRDSSTFHVCLKIKTADGCQDTWCERIIISPTVPWVPVIGGEDNHTIVVPHQLQSSVNIEKGDYIGLFFKNFFGELVCGGMIRWEGVNDVLTAWENSSYVFPADSSSFPIPWYKNGFYPGEKFEYKIWKWRTNQEILIQKAGYTVNNMFPDSCFYIDDGLSLLKSLIVSDQQTITLHNGWNLSSLYLAPNSIEMKEIFGDKNVIVKNYKGEIVYFPGVGITDGVWNSYEGYKIRAFEKFQITVNGTNIDAQTVIPLPGNKLPYFLPYYYTRCYPIKLLMYQIHNNVRYVQTYRYYNGALRALNYIPKYEIDQIKYMQPGYAYKLSLILPMRSFVYPPIDLCDSTQLSNNGNLKGLIVYAESNRVLVIPEEVLSIGNGALVKAYTTNGTLVGDEIAEGGNTAITLWDTDIEEKYDEFVLEITENEVIQSYKLSFSKNTISDGDLYILQGIPNSIVENNSGKLKINVYPTIVRDELNIDINQYKSSSVEIAVYNLLGKKMKQTVYGNIAAGSKQLKINTVDLSAGHYLYEIRTTDSSVRGKFIVKK